LGEANDRTTQHGDASIGISSDIPFRRLWRLGAFDIPLRMLAAMLCTLVAYGALFVAHYGVP
jgi:hypothetical protein